VAINGAWIMGEYVTGKWSLTSNTTEKMGAILWQHDWGPLQVHVPITPPYITPSIPLLLLTSSSKYYLPSFSVQEKVDGASIALIGAGGGGSPVAVSTPAYLIPVEQCFDVASAKSFNSPLPGICFQMFSTRWVGFNLGDVAAGLMGVLTDALSALILSHFGGKIWSGNVDNKIFGLLSNTLMGTVANTTGGWGAASGGILGGITLMAGGAGAAVMFLALPVAVLGGWAAEGIGNKWGSKPSDAQPMPDSPPTSASSPPPSASPPATAPPPSASAPPAPSDVPVGPQLPNAAPPPKADDRSSSDNVSRP
jgi:hypothetical protein